jgi:hypothetical protein
MKYKRRVINKQDWVGLRLLFMGSAVENSLMGVDDWNRCHNYFIKKYGMEKIQHAFDLLNKEYRASNEFYLSKLSWGQSSYRPINVVAYTDEVTLIKLNGN